MNIKAIQKNWNDPESIYRPAPFWSWNSKLEKKRLICQIDSMKKAGMGGAFMHSRYGLKTPYLGKEWFECISACIQKAKAIDFKAYLYDEDRWPSGSAGGIITRDKDDYRLRYLEAQKVDSLDSLDHLAVFAIDLDSSGQLMHYSKIENSQTGHVKGDIYIFDNKKQQPRAWENDGTYIDTMSRECVAEFIRVTHQEYQKRYAGEFSKAVPAIFTDEPNYGFWISGNPQGQCRLFWTDKLPEIFKQRRGYNLIDKLPELFFDLAGSDFSKTRHDYFRTITELFVENFTQQIGQWCQDNNIKLTGHVLMEEKLAYQLSAVGACMPHYEYMQWPGIDILKEQADEIITAKQCTSVAAQLGKERVLSELYGCTGWNFPLEGHKYMADWQFALGVNFLCPHLSHYSLSGGAKRDYPASIIDHSSWWKYYKDVNTYLSRLSFMLSQGQPLRDILVIHPVESAWGIYNPKKGMLSDELNPLNEDIEKVIRKLTAEHLDWDFGDESLLEKYARVESNKIVVGKMTYKLVVIPSTVTLRQNTVDLLMAFMRAGGKVVIASQSPKRIDGKENRQIEELLSLSRRIDDPEKIGQEVDLAIPRRVSIQEAGKEFSQIWHILKQVENGHILFVQSHDRQNPHALNLSIRQVCEPVILWDPMTGKRRKIQSQCTEDGVSLSMEIGPTGSALLSFGLDVAAEDQNVCAAPLLEKQELWGQFDYELSEYNSMPLDYCRYRVDGGTWSEPVHTLEMDRQIRAKFGLSTRLGFEQQPWYLNQKDKTQAVSQSAEIEIQYDFTVDSLPKTCCLAMENPDQYIIQVNSQVVGEVIDCWIDEDIKIIPIQDVLTLGKNVIELKLAYTTDKELEEMYLVGDFGTAVSDKIKPAAPGNITVVDLPRQLPIGFWKDNNLAFYSGAVRYQLETASALYGKKVLIKVPQVRCVAMALHVNGTTLFCPWHPFVFDISAYLKETNNQIVLEIIGGRQNILGPLHVPKQAWTGPEQFDTTHAAWTKEYLVDKIGLEGPVVFEIYDNTKK